ncbi:MAG: hypothetical protein ACXABU_03585 [Candidatus Hodarchaeales archaeon]|jgi:hypothetical protein
MSIIKFFEQNYDLQHIKVLEAYQGYLVAGKVKKQPRCFWINKQNIEGVTEIAKIVAIETAFHGILSFIPGGSFAYRLIKDQIGYPPRYNIIFEPSFYEIKYNYISLDKEGQPKNIVDTVTQTVDDAAKLAVKAGEKLQDTIFDILKKKKTSNVSEGPPSDDPILGFTYIRFYDKTSLIRNKIIKKRIQVTESRSGKLTKKMVSELAPSIIISFKTTADEEAVDFLKHLQSLGFTVHFSDDVQD